MNVWIALSCFVLLLNPWTAVHAAFQIGIGMHDCTGPAGGVNFMGYANPSQYTRGVHMRLYARCFIFVNTPDDASNTGKRAVFCSNDLPMLSQNVKQHVIDLLQKDFGDLYTHENVMLSGTHTHAGPGGYHQYLLYSVTSLGYIQETAEAMVGGIYGAIVRAHNNIQNSNLYMAKGLLFNANRNRSPTGYDSNPQAERDMYAEEGNTDKLMTLLKITEATTGKDRAAINWFSVHCTSMNSSNSLVSGDNKGYASYLMEKQMNGQLFGLGEMNEEPYMASKWSKLRNNGSAFVAAFGQTNEGDSSPNTEGAFCLDTGLPCDNAGSTCPDDQGRERVTMCNSRGPGWMSGDKESTRLIGLHQFAKAFSLYNEANTTISGPIDYRHAWINMSNVVVDFRNGSTAKTCLPARGYSFAAGTTDGPGMFDFKQGDNSTGNAFWNFVRKFISDPSPEQVACHYPKPILLNTGEATFPYPWEPTILDIQLFRIGSLIILAVPGEFSTMAGRRLRRAILEIFQPSIPDAHVVIAGLSNSYSGYTTTFEEYVTQRYEAASTIFGPNALAAYIQEFSRLAWAMVPNTTAPSFPPPSHDPKERPPYFEDRLLTFLPPVVFDSAPPGRSFGEVVSGEDVKPVYLESEWAQASFHAGHPRNRFVNPMSQLEIPFLLVEKYTGPALHQVRESVENWLVRQRMSNLEIRILPDKSTNRLLVRLYPKKAIVFQHSSGSYESDGLVRPKPKELHVYIQKLTKKLIVVPAEESVGSGEELEEMWVAIRDDNDWDTEFLWSKSFSVSPFSTGVTRWQVSRRPGDMTKIMEAGMMGEKFEVSNLDLYDDTTYRFRYKGYDKSVSGSVFLHEGVSGVFKVQWNGTFSNADSELGQWIEMQNSYPLERPLDVFEI